MADASQDKSPRLGGQGRKGGQEPALTGGRALLHALEMLNAPDEQTRLDAVTALGELGSTDAFEHLLRILDDESQTRTVRHRAVWALTGFGRMALPHIIRLARSDERDTWESGLFALERLANNPDLSRSATSVLLDIMEHDSAIKRFHAAARIKAMAKFGEPRGLYPALMRALDDEDVGVRLNVLLALRDLKDRRAVPKLRQLLHDDNADVRRGAVEALGSIGDRRATLDVIPILEGEDQFAWGGAAEALGWLGDPRAIPALTKVIRDRNKSIDLRRRCVESLNHVMGTDTAGELIALLRDPDIPGDVRFRCCDGLSMRGDDSAFAVLVTALDDPAFSVRVNAINAIEQLARRLGVEKTPRFAIDALIACTIDNRVAYEGTPPYTEDRSVREVAIDALRGIGTHEVVRAIEDWRRSHASE